MRLLDNDYKTWPIEVRREMARAATDVADEIESGKLTCGANRCFHLNGAPCCSAGHAIARVPELYSEVKKRVNVPAPWGWPWPDNDDVFRDGFSPPSDAKRRYLAKVIRDWANKVNP
jgi:hypothetical protein